MNLNIQGRREWGLTRKKLGFQENQEENVEIKKKKQTPTNCQEKRRLEERRETKQHERRKDMMTRQLLGGKEEREPAAWKVRSSSHGPPSGGD